MGTQAKTSKGARTTATATSAVRPRGRAGKAGAGGVSWERLAGLLQCVVADVVRIERAAVERPSAYHKAKLDRRHGQMDMLCSLLGVEASASVSVQVAVGEAMDSLVRPGRFDAAERQLRAERLSRVKAFVKTGRLSEFEAVAADLGRRQQVREVSEK